MLFVIFDENMPLIEELTAIVAEIKVEFTQIAGHFFDDAQTPTILIDDYQTLKAAILAQDFFLAISDIERMLNGCAEAEVKEHFIGLCGARYRENKDSFIDLLENPTQPGNLLYFRVARTIYPEANFADLCKLLMPDIEGEWVVQLTAVRGTIAKRQRLRAQVSLHQVAFDDETSCLVDMTPTASSFTRVIRVHNNLFVMDNIESYDFNMHAQLYALLESENPPLLTAIAAHNEQLADLYLRLKRLTKEGASVREVMSLMVKRMASSGMSAGFGELASEQGSTSALRLAEYFHALPEPFKGELGACRGLGDIPNVERIVRDIEHLSCIETASLELSSVLENPVNAKVLDTRPSINEEEKNMLSMPYLAIKKGQPLVDFDVLPKIMRAPILSSQGVYQQMIVMDSDDLLALLTMLPITEYASFLSYANVESINFIVELGFVIGALSLQQCEALIDAIMEPSIRKRLVLESSHLTAAMVNTGDMSVITKLIGKLTGKELLALLKEVDVDGRTALHHLVFTNIGFQRLLGLYPNIKERKRALKAQDDYGQTLWHAAAIYEKTLKVILEYYKGFDEVVRRIVFRDSPGRTALHYAASELQPLKLLLSYFQGGDDELQDEDATIEVLLMTDEHGNTVFHLASNNPETLCFLLSHYTEPADAITTLCRKNNEGKSVVSLDDINYSVLGEVLELLLEKNVSDEDLACFLCQPSVHDEKTIYKVLLENQDGASILASLVSRRPGLLLSSLPTTNPRSPSVAESGFFAQNEARLDPHNAQFDDSLNRSGSQKEGQSPGL